MNEEQEEIRNEENQLIQRLEVQVIIRKQELEEHKFNVRKYEELEIKRINII